MFAAAMERRERVAVRRDSAASATRSRRSRRRAWIRFLLRVIRVPSNLDSKGAVGSLLISILPQNSSMIPFWGLSISATVVRRTG